MPSRAVPVTVPEAIAIDSFKPLGLTTPTQPINKVAAMLIASLAMDSSVFVFTLVIVASRSVGHTLPQMRVFHRHLLSVD